MIYRINSPFKSKIYFKYHVFLILFILSIPAKYLYWFFVFYQMIFANWRTTGRLLRAWPAAKK
jgi:hypothetical protein